VCKFIRGDIETLLRNKAALDTAQAAATNIALDGIAAAIAGGLTVELRGLGTFGLRVRRGHKARNPRTAEAVSVPARRVIYFKPAGRKTKGGSKGVAGMKTANSMLPGLPPLWREGNIICFPGAWREETPDPPKAPEKPPLPSFEDHCEGFSGADFGGIHHRILWALYYLRVHSLDDLAKTPVSKLRLRNRIGRKSLERILAALESRGYAPGKDWDVIAGAKRHEG
jgi:integration host factor subunit beta